jgi:hypothetical protein
VEVHAILDSPVWVQGRGGASYPSESHNIISDFKEKRFFGLISTCSNPYSIDDLLTSYIKVGYHFHRGSLWTDWYLLHHPLYREDHLAVMYGQALLIEGFLIQVKPSFERRQVLGFPSESVGILTIMAVYEWMRFVCFGLDWSILNSGFSGSSLVISKLSLQMDSFAFVVNQVHNRPPERDIRVGVEVELDEKLSLLSGYRLSTDEVSGGVLYTGGRFIFGLTWRHHPAMGVTLSLGVGRLWFR